jgi:hypothetical protein
MVYLTLGFGSLIGRCTFARSTNRLASVVVDFGVNNEKPSGGDDTLRL